MTESPFQSGYQVYWDATSIALFKECPRKYYYTIIKGYRPRGDSIHLRFGILYHTALEEYHKARAFGTDHDNSVAQVVLNALRATWDESGGWETGHNLKTRYALIRTVIWYLEEFRNDAAKTVILANGTPAVELHFNFPLYNGISLCGHLDRIVEFQEGYYVMDYKTTGSTPGSYYFDQFSPDPQMSLYTIAGQIIYKSPIRGVIIDAAQVAVGFSRFSRGVVYRTPALDAEWLADLSAWFALAHSYTDQFPDRPWPMNDKSCHKFGGCPFRSICSRDPSVRETFLANDFEVRPWNPLEIR